MTNLARILATSALVALPTTGFAGGYGDTAVKDATVGQSASSGATVYCERLDQNVPERLATRMDCGGSKARARTGLGRFIAGLTGNGGSGGSDDVGEARPRVLSGGLDDGDGGNGDNNDAGSGGGAGGSSSGGGGNSGGGNNNTGGGSGGGNSGGGNSGGGNSGGGNSGGGDSGGGNSGGGNSGGGNSGGGNSGGGDSGFTSKWDRLADFGVNRDNYKSQSQELRDEIKEYRKENGGKGNWSDFNPTSN